MIKERLWRRAFTLCVSIGLLGWGTAFGQGDNCGTAVAVTPGMYTADGPATGGGASLICFPADATNADWYSYTPTQDGVISVNSCLGGLDTRLSIYSGACGTLTCEGSNDDSCLETPTGFGYASEVIDLPVTAGTTYYIEWDDRWGTTTFDWTLDYTCLLGGVSVAGITTSSADVSFSACGTGTVYVEYGPPGFTPGTGATAGGGTVVSGPASPINISGLTAGTCYDVYVREDLGGSFTPNAQTAFCTSCTGTTPLPYTQNANGAAFPAIPPCMTQIDDGNGTTWGTSAAPAGFAGGVIRINGDPTFAQDDWIFAQGISGVALGQSVTIQWDEGNAGATASTYEVTVGTSPSATLNVIGTFSVPTGGGVSTTQSIDYVNLLSGDLYFGFHATSAIGAPDLFIDNIVIDNTPTCDTPDQPTFSSITGTTADVNFTCSGCTGTYEVIYGPPGFDPNATGTSVTGASSPISLTGLTGLTDYDVYLRQDCGAGGLSFFTTVESFTTGCVTFTAPWGEDFDAGTASNTTPPPCFSTSLGAGSGWEFDGPAGFNTSCGAPGAGPSGSGFFAMVDYSTPTEVNVVMELPLVDVSGLTTPQLSFATYMCATSNAPNPLFIEYWDGAAWQLLSSLTSATAGAGAGATGWQDVAINLTPAVVGGIVQLRMRAEDGGGPSSFNGDRGVDDLLIDEAPTCLQVDAGTLAAGSPTTSSVDVSWACTGCTGAFSVIYGAPGFDPATAGTTVPVGASPATISGLTDNTTYDFYIFQDCGGGDISDTTGAVSATTLCLPTSVPYFEDYASFPDNVTPDCYTVFDGGSNTSGGIYNWATDVALTGTGYGSGGTHMEVYSNQTGYDFFWMQELNLVGGTSYRIQYFAGQSNTTAGNQNMLEVSYNTSPDSAGRTIITDFMLPTGSTAGQFYVHDFTPAVTGVYSIGFGAHRTVTNFAYYQIDDLEVIETPSCSPVLSLTTAPFGTDSILVDWDCAGCTGTYIVEYGPAGFTPGSDATAGVGGTIITATGDSAFIDLATVPVFCATLEVYVRQECTGPEWSPNTGPGTFGTLAGTSVAPYLETMDGAANNALIPNPCWSQTSTDNWTIAPSGDGGPFYGVGGSVDHTSGSGNFMWIDASSDIGANSLETGDIDFSGLASPYVGFWLLMNNIDDAKRNSVTLSYWDGAAWVQILDVESPQNPNWVQVGACIPAAAPNPTRFRIQAVGDVINPGSQFYNDALIDDFFVDEAPCLAPVASAINISSSATDITWDDNCALGTYALEWGPAGFTPGSGGTLVSPASPDVNITGLTELTMYEAYVWQECGPGTNSDTTVVAWTTAPDCQPVTDLAASATATDADITWTCATCTGTFSIEWGLSPLTPGSGTVIDPATSGTNISGLMAATTYDVLVWQTCGAGPANSDTVLLTFTTASGCIGAWTDNGGAGNYTINADETITFCPENPGEILQVTFNSFQTETSYDGLFIFDGPTDDPLTAFPGNPGTLFGALSAASAGYGGILPYRGNGGTPLTPPPGPFIGSSPSGCLTFRFVSDASVTYAGWDAVVECFSCEAPSALSVSNIAADAADIDWSCNVLCSGTFELEYGPAGFTPGSGGTIITPASAPQSITGLMADTDYDVYIWQDCGGGDISDTSFVSFTTAPACAPVTGLSASANSGSDVDVSWGCAGCTGTFIIEYGPAGFTQGSGGTYVNPATSPQNIAGLMDQTTYDFYVWQDCGGGDASDTVSTSITTPCNPFTIPFFENFDAAANNALVPNACWTQNSTDNWTVAPSGDAGPGYDIAGSVDHTSGSGNFMWIDGSGTAPGIGPNELITPLIDYTGAASPIVSYWLLANNGTDAIRNEVSLDYWDGAAWVNISVTPSPQNPDWVQISSPIPGGAPNPVQFRIQGLPDLVNPGSQFYNDLLIDDFFVGAPPTCDSPISVAAAGVTASSADISWTCAGCTGDYYIEVGPTGFTPGTGATAGGGTVFATGSMTMGTVSGLAAATEYQAYVRQDCGGTDGFSLNGGPAVFTTACLAFTAPWSEDFDAGTATNSTPPLCFGNSSTSGNGWEFDGPAGFNGSCGAPGAGPSGTGFFAMIDYSTTGGTIGTGTDVGALMTLPLIDVSGLTAPWLEFSTYMCATSNAPNPLFVEYYDGATWQILSSLTTATAAAGAGTSGWELVGIDLSPAVVGGIVQLRFRGEDGGGPSSFNGDRGVDDLSIDEAPTCPDPTGLAVSGITSSGADITWDCTSCAGTQNLEWGPAGFTIGSGTLISPATSPTTLSGGMSVTTYDVYLWVDCGPGDQSDTLFTSFTTAPGCGDAWTDNGGAGDYLADSDETTTFCPDTPGEAVVVTFSSFDTETNWDGLFVFDGPTDDPLTAFPGIAGTLSGALNTAANSYTPSILPYRGNGPTAGSLSPLPGPFISSHPSGCLTFRFVSDGSVFYPGWDATINCIETNFVCADADTVFCGDFIGGVVTGTNSLPATACDFNGGNSTGGTWYVHVGTGDDMQASTCGLAGFDTRISVFEGPDCNTLTCIGGSDDVTGCGSNTSEINFATTPGTLYYIAVHGVDGSQGSFTLDLVCTTPCAPAAAGDDCASAVGITPVVADGFGVPAIYDNTCAYVDGPVACSGALPVQGQFFTFNAGTSSVFYLTLNTNNENAAMTSTAIGYSLYAGTSCSGLGAGGTPIACNASGAGTNIITGLTPGADYTLEVWSEGGIGVEGTYELLLEYAPALDASVEAILSPIEWDFISTSVCGSQIQPVILLKNNGTDDLTSVDISWDIDFGTPQTITWTGFLTFGAQTGVALPITNTPFGVHTLNVSTSNPNGGVDEVPANDSQSVLYNAEGEEVKVHIVSDNFGAQTTWEIFDAFFLSAGAGGPYPNNVDVTETLCLPTTFGTCYSFYVFDSFGDGMCCANGIGEWELYDTFDNLILRDSGEFASQSPSPTPPSPGYVNGHEFCLPLGPSSIAASDCNVFTNDLKDRVYATFVPGAADYQFEFMNPDEGFRRFIATGQRWVQFSQLTSNPTYPLVVGTAYFARARVDQGASGFFDDHFGAGCDMMIDALQVPGCTQLIDTPGPTFSCGVSRQLDVGQKLWARPVFGASGYQFRMENASEGYLRFLATPSYVLNLNTWAVLPMQVGFTYDVTVQVYVAGQPGGFCGAPCTVTILPPPPATSGLKIDEVAATGVSMYPNPVRDGQVQLMLTDLVDEEQNITVDVFDLFGKRVMAKEYGNSGSVFNTIMDVDDLAAGTYMVHITINEETLVERLMVH